MFMKYTSYTSLFGGKYIQIAVICLGKKNMLGKPSLADFPQGPGSDFRVEL